MKTKILVTGLAATAAAVAVTVPASGAGAPSGPMVSVAGHRYFVDAGDTRRHLEQQIDAAVSAGWLPPRLAAKLQQQLASAERFLRPRAGVLRPGVLAWAAKALGTTQRQLRAELRAGLTFRQLLAIHAGPTGTVLRRLLDRLDLPTGAALGPGAPERTGEKLGAQASATRGGAPEPQG